MTTFCRPIIWNNIALETCPTHVNQYISIYLLTEPAALGLELYDLVIEAHDTRFSVGWWSAGTVESPALVSLWSVT